MDMKDKVVTVSQDVVVREIQGEIVIVPITAGIGDLTDKMFSLNEIGKIIFELVDGEKSVDEITDAIADEYDAPRAEIQKDVLEFINELLEYKILV